MRLLIMLMGNGFRGINSIIQYGAIVLYWCNKMEVAAVECIDRLVPALDQLNWFFGKTGQACLCLIDHLGERHETFEVLTLLMNSLSATQSASLYDVHGGYAGCASL